jgi:hypothetical protein
LTEKKQKDRRAYPYGFYVIDNRIFLFGLTTAELAVYNCVARHGNAHFLAHLRMATIAAECGCSVNTARKAAHALREKRLVSISEDFRDSPDGGKWHGANYYQLLEVPEYVEHRVPQQRSKGSPGDGVWNNTQLEKEYGPAPERDELPF